MSSRNDLVSRLYSPYDKRMKEQKREKTFRLTLVLPDGLAEEAERSGLLTSQAIEALIRAELRQRRVQRLFEAADQLAALDMPPLTEAEVEAEIQAARFKAVASDPILELGKQPIVADVDDASTNLDRYLYK